MTVENDLKQAIVNLKQQGIGDLVKTALADGMPPLKILDSLKSGLETVGDLYPGGNTSSQNSTWRVRLCRPLWKY
jgi:methanogenic corrinoid protein MtbC1